MLKGKKLGGLKLGGSSIGGAKSIVNNANKNNSTNKVQNIRIEIEIKDKVKKLDINIAWSF